MFASFKNALSKFFEQLIQKLRSRLHVPKWYHVRLFLFSLLLSIAFWCFVSYDNNANAVITLDVPIHYSGLASGLDKKVSKDVVKVKVIGKDKNLSKLSTDDIDATVDLRGKTVGKYTLDINTKISHGGVSISKVSPAHTEVTIFRVDKKNLPISVDLTDRASNKDISEIILTPSQVVVSGKKNAIKAISKLSVSLDTEKLDANRDITLPITVTSESNEFREGEDYTLSQKNVVAHVVFGNEIVTRKLPVTFTLVGKPQNGAEIVRTILFPSEIEITAKASFFKEIKQIDLGKVDVSSVSKTTVLEVPFVLPDALKKAQDSVKFDAPNKIKLEVVCKEPRTRKVYDNVPIRLVGQGNPNWTLTTQTASVTIETTASVLASFNGEPPFVIFVDPTDIVQRKVTLPISFRAQKAGVKLINISPSMATLEKQ